MMTDSIGGNLRVLEEAERSVLDLRLAVLEREVLRQAEAEPHDDAPLDLRLHLDRVDGPADVVRRDDLLEHPVRVEEDDVRGVRVGDVAHRVLLVAGEGVGDAGELGVVLLPLELGERRRREVLLQVGGGAAGRLSGEEGLAGGGRRPAVRGVGGVGRRHVDLVPGEAGGLGDELHQDGGEPLAHAGGARVDDRLPLLHDQPHAADVGEADADPGVLHGAGDPGVGALLAELLHREEGLLQAGPLVADLAVREDVARPAGVAASGSPTASVPPPSRSG